MSARSPMRQLLSRVSSSHASRATKALRAVATAVAFASTAACGGYTEVHEVMFRPPTPPTGRDVQVYVGDQAPPNAFYEVAMLQAIGFDGDSDLEDVMGALRERGRVLGCDGIIRVRVELGYSMAHGYGVCVKWRAPTAKPPAPLPISG
ncbi:hypothetical protein [Pendulispora albinea]|uniref:Lipoprotein n=1 Tax=Pendulispora albinea TaxID=2741071 RepID=A0ABZ2LR39_9BACT